MIKPVLFLSMLLLLAGCIKPAEPSPSSEVAGTYTLTYYEHNYIKYSLIAGGTITFVEKSENEVKVSQMIHGKTRITSIEGFQFPVSKTTNSILFGDNLGTLKDGILELNFVQRNSFGQTLGFWVIRGVKN